jgi:hypothetical protein
MYTFRMTKRQPQVSISLSTTNSLYVPSLFWERSFMRTCCLTSSTRGRLSSRFPDSSWSSLDISETKFHHFARNPKQCCKPGYSGIFDRTQQFRGSEHFSRKEIRFLLKAVLRRRLEAG